MDNINLSKDLESSLKAVNQYGENLTQGGEAIANFVNKLQRDEPGLEVKLVRNANRFSVIVKKDGKFLGEQELDWSHLKSLDSASVRQQISAVIFDILDFSEDLGTPSACNLGEECESCQ